MQKSVIYPQLPALALFSFGKPWAPKSPSCYLPSSHELMPHRYGCCGSSAASIATVGARLVWILGPASQTATIARLKNLLDQHMSRKKYGSHQATVDKLAIINRIHERALEWREAAHLKSGDMLAQ